MRFPAARMFSVEINSVSKFEEEKVQEKAIKIAVSPLGRKVGRVFHIGTVIEVREVGENMLIARIADRYGAYMLISNAMYQPQVYATLKEITIPSYVAVVGKIRKKDGFSRPFIRPEYLSVVGKKEAQLWEKEATMITEKLTKEIEKNMEKGTTMYSKEEVEKLLNLIKSKKETQSEEKADREEEVEVDPEEYTFEIDTETIGLEDLKDYD